MTAPWNLTSFRVGLALHTLAAVVCSFVPLFDVLGFERAFVSGLIAAPIAAAVAIASVKAARRRGGARPVQIFYSTALACSSMLLVTVVAGGVVELIRQPCNPGEGLLYIVICAGGSTLVGASLGVALCTLSSRAALAGVLTGVALVAELARAGWRLYAHPQIYAYSLPFGFWPGSIYDEGVGITEALWTHRALAALVAGSLVAVVEVFTDRDKLLIFRGRPRLSALFPAVLLCVAAGWLAARGEALGFDRTRATIDEALIRQVDTPRYELRVDPAIHPKQLEALTDDVELRYRQLAAFFGRTPEAPIRVYVYRDTAQKQQLMGASGTQIARPWAGEIHIHGFATPHRVLKHELAHIFAADLATGPFRVPAAMGVMVNLGIVEGLAVAADWPARQLTVHEWAAAMRKLDLAPDPRQTLYPAGFWAISSSRAYTVAGSFLRHLYDEHGIEKLGALYRTNDFQAAYGAPLDTLVARWEAFLDALHLDDADVLLAEHRFKQPGVFQKVCAHVAARLETKGYALLNSGDLEGGEALLSQVAAYRPNSTAEFLAVSGAYARRGDLETATRWVQRADEVTGISARSSSRVRSARADVDWRSDRLTAAREGYARVVIAPLPPGDQRLVLAKRSALDKPPELQAVLREYLLGDLPGSRALVEFDDLLARHEGDGLLNYLYARNLERIGAFAQGTEAARRALDLPLPGTPVRHEAELMLGRMYLGAGEPRRALTHFQRLAGAAQRPCDELQATDWAARAWIVATRTSTTGIGVDMPRFER